MHYPGSLTKSLILHRQLALNQTQAFGIQPQFNGWILQKMKKPS
jgi:hypothetical protein